MANPSPRSAGVTAAATLAILGCGSAFFFWGYYLLLFLNVPPNDQGKHLYDLHPWFSVGIALIPSAVIGVGIRTGIGLFQLRPWARVSAMVWAAITLAFCLTLIALRPYETFFFPDHFVGETEALKQLIAVALVIFLLPVSVWWLFLFRTKSVKRQFALREEESGGSAVPITERA